MHPRVIPSRSNPEAHAKTGQRLFFFSGRQWIDLELSRSKFFEAEEHRLPTLLLFLESILASNAHFKLILRVSDNEWAGTVRAVAGANASGLRSGSARYYLERRRQERRCIEARGGGGGGARGKETEHVGESRSCSTLAYDF
jgi:hypothetical protein